MFWLRTIDWVLEKGRVCSEWYLISLVEGGGGIRGMRMQTESNF